MAAKRSGLTQALALTVTSIAANITKRREQLGLTQAQLADLLGVSAATISRWESGASSPARNNLGPLASALQTTASFFHGESGPTQDLDVDRLAQTFAALEAALGNRLAALAALQRAKLVAFVYARGGQVTNEDARGLLGLIA